MQRFSVRCIAESHSIAEWADHLYGILQIQVGLEAFLAKPDSGPVDFRDCAQVINPFIVTTKIDHCVEPTALSTYRQACTPSE